MSNLISIKELADHLGISVKTLRVRVSKGKIAQPVKREGDALYWDRKAVGIEPLDIYGTADGFKPFTDLTGYGRKQMFAQSEADDINERILKGPRRVVVDDDVRHIYLEPLVLLTDADNLPTERREVDALIGLQDIPLPSGASMRIVKGRDSGEYKLDVNIKDANPQPGMPDPFRPLMEGGLRRDEVVVYGASSPGYVRRSETSLLSQAEASIRSRGLEPTDDMELIFTQTGSAPRKVTLGEIKRWAHNPVGDFEGDVLDIDTMVAAGTVSAYQATLMKARALPGEFNVDILNQPPRSYADDLGKKDKE